MTHPPAGPSTPPPPSGPKVRYAGVAVDDLFDLAASLYDSGAAGKAVPVGLPTPASVAGSEGRAGGAPGTVPFAFSNGRPVFYGPIGAAVFPPDGPFPGSPPNPTPPDPGPPQAGGDDPPQPGHPGPPPTPPFPPPPVCLIP